MAFVDKETLEALSSSRILTSMITPAVLISACGTLIFSTSARLGRIFDRVNVMKGEVEGVIAGKISHPTERMEFLQEQVALAKKRATLIQKAMATLYSATALFVASSLGIAANVAFGSPEQGWIPTLIALSGGVFLFVASALLLYESRFNLTFVTRNIEFIEFLQEKAIEQNKS
jgi:ABC-type multidrug transport system fused ATPase/permease subunit